MYSFLNGADFKSYLDTVDVNTELFHLVYMLGYSDYNTTQSRLRTCYLIFYISMVVHTLAFLLPH